MRSLIRLWMRSFHWGMLAGVCHWFWCWIRVWTRAAKRLRGAWWLGLLLWGAMLCQMGFCGFSGSIKPRIRRSSPCCHVYWASGWLLCWLRCAASLPQRMLSWAMVSWIRGRSSRVSWWVARMSSLSNRAMSLSASKRLSIRARVCARASSRGWRWAIWVSDRV